MLARFIVIVILTATAAFAGEDSPIGWASVEGGGTTGGKAGKTMTATDRRSLWVAGKSKAPLVIQISGTIEMSSTLKLESDKTMIGLGTDAAIKGGGLKVDGAHNVIIRNLTISGAPVGIGIERGAHHVWIDHCDLSKCQDGLIDVKRGADYVTVSWNRLHDHEKTCLLGHSDKPDTPHGDVGRLRVTYHHNFFDGCQTRHPRVRFGEPVHVFNNYYLKNEYGVASTMDAGLLFEGNYVEDVPHPTHTQYAKSKPGRLVERHNIYVRSGQPEASGEVAEPRDSYRYSLDKAADIPDLVRRGAGVGKIAK